MKIIELDKEEFLDFSKNNPQALFFQTPYWIEIKEKNNWTGKIIGVKEKDKIVIASIILIKEVKQIHKKIAYAPRGFLMDYDNLELLEEFTKEIKNYLKKENIIFLKINPYIDYQERDINGEIIPNTRKDALMNKLKELGYKHNGFYVDQDNKTDLEPRWISVLDVKNKKMDELLKNMRSSTKWRINNSKKNALTIIEADEDNLIEFKNLMKHTAERREFIDRPLSYYQEMFKILKRENLVKVLLVEINFKELLERSKLELEKDNNRLKELENNPKKARELKEIKLEIERLNDKIKVLTDTINTDGEKKIIAGGWYMLFGREIVYLFGASYKKYMKYNSQYLLQEYMINYTIDNNYDKFNFYGIDGNFNENAKGYGLFDFKRGFGACVHELIGEFDLIIDPVMYKVYKVSFKSYKVLKQIKNKIKKNK